MTTCLTIPFYLKGNMVNLPYHLTMKHYATYIHGVDVHFCGSEGNFSREFVTRRIPQANYHEVPQNGFCTISRGDDHIRSKFNRSIQTFGRGYDWYCLAGADDIAPQVVFDQLKNLDPSEVIMAGVGMDQPLYIRDTRNGEKFRCRLKYGMKLNLLPGINIFSRAAMEKCKWKPYTLHGCETGAELYFTQHGRIVPLEGYVLMLKGDGCLNDVQKIKQRHQVIQLTDDELKLVESYL